MVIDIFLINMPLYAINDGLNSLIIGVKILYISRSLYILNDP